MYKIDQIREIHLEVTSNCQAKCPMCARRPHGGMLNPFINLNDIDLETFKKWFPVSFIEQLNRLFMCGNLGDPIIAQDTLEIFKYIRKINPDINLSMNTNGSARSNNWWKELAETKVGVLFGIDGLEDTHHLYRISTDWNKIIENSKTFILAGGYAEWHMLVFKHNEHQIEECRRLANEIGFSKFLTKHTSRFSEGSFPVLDEDGRTLYNLHPSQKSLEMIPKIAESIVDVKPNSINCIVKKSNSLYIGSDGTVSPCCWLDLKWLPHQMPKRINYMNYIGEFPNLYQNTLEEIFDSNFFERIEMTWKNDPLLECSRQCGKFEKFRNQFDEN
jgi:MoaA/NifB/PqqE/SkfB family radical SAM enzyme